MNSDRLFTNHGSVRCLCAALYLCGTMGVSELRLRFLGNELFYRSHSLISGTRAYLLYTQAFALHRISLQIPSWALRMGHRPKLRASAKPGTELCSSPSHKHFQGY